MTGNRLANVTVARAAMRLDFAGGYTDVAAYSDHEPGAVTNIAIQRYATATLTLGGAGIRLASADLREELVFQGVAELRYDGSLDLHKAALNLLPVTGPLRLETQCDAPLGSGLGSSGAIGVALAGALARARGDRYGSVELAELAFSAEVQELGITGGRQDQYAAALGGAHFFTFHQGEVTIDRLALAPEFCDALNRHLVVVYTGQSRVSADVHERVWAAYANDDTATVRALRGLRECAVRARDALGAGDLIALGRAVSDNWAHQRELAPELETPVMADLAAVAADAGVLGGKAAGAGGGGCLFFLAHDAPRLVDALAEKGARPLSVAVAPDGVSVEDRAV